MKTTKRKPAYLTIAQSGGNYSVTYYKNKGETGSLSGYNMDTFKEVPENIPLIDFRTADSERLIKFILNEPGPNETDIFGGQTLASYLERVKATGATVTTLQELKAAQHLLTIWEDKRRRNAYKRKVLKHFDPVQFDTVFKSLQAIQF